MTASWKPRSYQRVGVKLMIAQACAGLLYKPGLGKTSVVYMAFRILQDKQFVEKALVICPVRPAYNVWPNQKNNYEEFKHLRVGLLHGPDKERVLQSDEYDLYVVNPEGLQWLFGAKLNGSRVVMDPQRVSLIKKKFQMLVVDESTKFKNSQTQRFKLLKSFVGFFKRRYIMTGTPMPKSLLDLFGQVYILDEGSSLGRYITHYRTKYFYPSGYGGYEWLPLPGAHDQIMEQINELVQVVLPEGNIELPEIIYNDIYVDLPPKAQQQYDNMEDELVAAVDDEKVVASNAAVASGKCRQIANGAVYSEDGSYTRLHTAKYDALADLLEELQGEPCLVTYEFKFDEEWLVNEMKIPSASTGNAKKDNAVIAKFSSGDMIAMCGNPASISLGTDGLQNSCFNIAMLGVTWKAQDYEQVIDRVRRSGNKSKKVIVHRIIAAGTLDERAIRVVDGRMGDQKDFMKALKEMRDERRKK